MESKIHCLCILLVYIRAGLVTLKSFSYIQDSLSAVTKKPAFNLGVVLILGLKYSLADGKWRVGRNAAEQNGALISVQIFGLDSFVGLAALGDDRPQRTFH